METTTTKLILGIGTIMVTLLLCGSCNHPDETDAKPENFYRIKGDFYHRIEESEIGRYASADSGCVFAIASEAMTIPLADNPKKKAVLFLAGPTEVMDRAAELDWAKPRPNDSCKDLSGLQNGDIP